MPVWTRLVSTYRSRLLLVGVLVASTLLSLGALAARRFISGSNMYHFLPWNLFLAWLPFVFAVGMYFLHVKGIKRDRLLLTLGICWLLFLPNAPYLWTDLVHIVIRRSAAVYWCDLVLGVTYGWNGMLLGLLSLRIVHRIARDRLGMLQGWLIALISLALGSFSISLGRFDRFNSWDVISRPVTLLGNIANEFLHPFAHSVHFAMAAMFFAFWLTSYLMLLAILAVGHEESEQPAAMGQGMGGRVASR